MSEMVTVAQAYELLNHMKLDREKAITDRDNARHERDDAHDVARVQAEAAAKALKDLAAYKQDRADLADIVDDLEEQNASLRARLEDEGLEA